MPADLSQLGKSDQVIIKFDGDKPLVSLQGNLSPTKLALASFVLGRISNKMADQAEAQAIAEAQMVARMMGPQGGPKS